MRGIAAGVLPRAASFGEKVNRGIWEVTDLLGPYRMRPLQHRNIFARHEIRCN
jgi:hypothetical protein